MIDAGEFGHAHEAARAFGMDIGVSMAEEGWTRTPKGADADGESPEDLARIMPRG